MNAARDPRARDVSPRNRELRCSSGPRTCEMLRRAYQVNGPALGAASSCPRWGADLRLRSAFDADRAVSRPIGAGGLPFHPRTVNQVCAGSCAITQWVVVRGTRYRPGDVWPKLTNATAYDESQEGPGRLGSGRTLNVGQRRARGAQQSCPIPLTCSFL